MKTSKMIIALVAVLCAQNVYSAAKIGGGAVRGSGIAVTTPTTGAKLTVDQMEKGKTALKALFRAVVDGVMPNGTPIWDQNTGAVLPIWTNSMLNVGKSAVKDGIVTRDYLDKNIKDALYDGMMSRKNLEFKYDVNSIKQAHDTIMKGIPAVQAAATGTKVSKLSANEAKVMQFKMLLMPLMQAKALDDLSEIVGLAKDLINSGAQTPAMINKTIEDVVQAGLYFHPSDRDVIEDQKELIITNIF